MGFGESWGEKKLNALYALSVKGTEDNLVCPEVISETFDLVLAYYFR